ncbi:MAG: sulfatase [Alphaproteobacteria bacterium]|nr:sulfatase [Alphaproteobacteria bacterium]
MLLLPDLAACLLAALVVVLVGRSRPALRAVGGAVCMGLLVARALTTPVPPPQAPAAGQGRLLVFVTLDTFRADHLGVIGGAPVPVETPSLDALAADGVLVSRAIAPVALTLPSHVGMLSGTPPLDLGVVRNGAMVPADAPLVAAGLSDQGWVTGAFVSARVLDHGTGLDRGFGHYDDVLGPLHVVRASLPGQLLAAVGLLPHTARQRRGDETIARALSWLDRQDPARDRFLWVHLFDPHHPYDAPAPFAGRYADTPDLPGGPDEMRALRERLGLGPMQLLGVPRDMRPFITAYAEEIAWTDHLVGELRGALPADATFVVAADHGESLIEHDYVMGHGGRLHEVGVRSWVIAAGPGLPHGLRRDDPVSLLGVADALRALAAGDGPAGVLAEPPLPLPDIFLFAGTQESRAMPGLPASALRVGWRQAELKQVVHADGEVLAWDLAADPDEVAPVEVELPDLRDRGLSAIDALQAAEAAVEEGLSADEAEALRALGYVE